jgi:hypothetical protein
MIILNFGYVIVAIPSIPSSSLIVEVIIRYYLEIFLGCKGDFIANFTEKNKNMKKFVKKIRKEYSLDDISQ